MTDINEIKKCMRLLTSSQMAFATVRHDLLVTRTVCNRHPSYDSETEEAVKNVFMEDETLREDYYKALVDYYQKNYIKESFMVKELVSLLSDLSDAGTLRTMILAALKIQSIEAGKAYRKLLQEVF